MIQLIWLGVTEEEYEEIQLGLECIISHLAGSKAEREPAEELKKKLEKQKKDLEEWKEHNP